MRTNVLSIIRWLSLASLVLFAAACTSFLPPNIPLTGLEPTITSLPPFPSATPSQAPATAVGVVTVVVTATPEPATPTATSAPPTATKPAASGCSYQVTFVRDVTIPDNSTVKAGASFVKTWRVRNDGTCAWGPGQKLDRLAFYGGSAMSGPASVAIPQVVQPGATIDLSVSLAAPAKAGAYVGEWMLQTSGGAFVGSGSGGAHPLTVVIKVGATPTPEADDDACLYQAGFVEDVTFPDNFVVAPGEYITKIWRVRNTGTCAWGADRGPYYLDRLVFTGGDLLGAPSSVALPGDGVILPGETFDINVNMVMPALPGTYRSEWMFGSSSGGSLGAGADGDAPFYAQLVVVLTYVPSPATVVDIEFGPGETQTSFDVYVDAKIPLGYKLRVMGGQKMTIIASGSIAVGVLDKNLSPLGIVHPQPKVWTVSIPKTGDYTVVIYGSGDTSVTIKIPPL